MSSVSYTHLVVLTDSLNTKLEETRINMYKTIAVSTLLYGSESRFLPERKENHIQAVEVKFLNPVKGYRREDRNKKHETHMKGIANIQFAGYKNIK